VGILKLNQILTLLGLGPILLNEDGEVKEKIKIAHLARAYYPCMIANFSQSAAFYEKSVEELKELICKAEPGMRGVFQKYLVEHKELLREVEIFPGQATWEIADLASQVRDAGGWGLMAGMGGDGTRFEDVCDYVIKRLVYGTVSTETRLSSGWLVLGESVIEDLQSGGADQAFTRMVADPLAQTSIDSYNFFGKIQVLYDLETINRGAYAYPQDSWGSKKNRFYDRRDNLVDFTRNLNADSEENEVMIKGRILPEFICGVVVSTEGEKAILIQKLRAAKLVINERVNGVPIQRFVYVKAIDQPFTKDMWSRDE
jgi:hypothetical protein